MTADTTPIVVAARRTPIAARGGRLAHVDVATLAAIATGAAVADAALLGVRGRVDDVHLGNCLGPGGNPARVAALAAGLGVETPGVTIDRQCGSGLAAVLTGADAVRAGASFVVAGGAESASTAPERRVDGVAYERAPFAPAGFADPDMAAAAQDLAMLDGVSRAAQDAYAARSHRLAVEADREGRFAAEIVPVEVGGAGRVDRDDGPRPGAERVIARTPALDASAPAALALTAGNTCRINDGAAAVTIVPQRSRSSLPGLALRASAVTGCDPALPGLGPVDAIAAALDRAGSSLADVAAIELIEAFAAQALAVLRRLGLADGTPGAERADAIDARVCADGGALALGHPWGASGAVSVVRLFSRLVRRGAPAGSLGVSAAAIGGGMGIAAVWEVVR